MLPINKKYFFTDIYNNNVVCKFDNDVICKNEVKYYETYSKKFLCNYHANKYEDDNIKSNIIQILF